MLKGSAYIFYSRGKINIKGLGERQTYFVEPPSSDVKLQLDVVRNDSGEFGTVPVVNVDGEAEPSTSVKKEEVLRSPSFVTYNKCTMVSTPSVQFIQNLPMCTNPNFETNGDGDDHRPERVSSPGLQMRRLVPGSTYTPSGSPNVTPRTSNAESPESQLKKSNRIAPHNGNSRSELRQPPPSIMEVPETIESGRVSRNSNSSGTIIDAFISKNDGQGSSSVDPGASGSSSEGSEQENSSDHSENGDGSRGSRSNRRAKKAKCVIS